MSVTSIRLNIIHWLHYTFTRLGSMGMGIFVLSATCVLILQVKEFITREFVWPSLNESLTENFFLALKIDQCKKCFM